MPVEDGFSDTYAGGFVPRTDVPMTQRLVAMAFLLIATPSPTADRPLRVATYNIKFLSVSLAEARVRNLREVVRLLDADVVGLQEVDDRAALELVFSPREWLLVIDDDSGDEQDLAVAVRKPLKVAGLNRDPNDLDADDDDFLFSGPRHPDVKGNNAEYFFPNRRDVLSVCVETPAGNRFWVLVTHAKSRRGGRAETENRRVGAAESVVKVLKRDYASRDFVFLGDMNDNPDDRSLNVLETGDPNARPEAENKDGPFLANLCEPLLAEERVSWGLREEKARPDGSLDTFDKGSRARNNTSRGGKDIIAPILFDQLLVPVRMKSKVAGGTARIFDRAVAVSGGRDEQASDHLPVYADLLYRGLADTPKPAVAGSAASTPKPAGTQQGKGALRIAALLPNPSGKDEGAEWVEVANSSEAAVSLEGWTLRDEAGNSLDLSGSVPAKGALRVTLPEGKMPLNNNGDTVVLFGPHGVSDRISYGSEAAASGEVVRPTR